VASPARDQAGDRLVGQAFPRDPAGLADRTEQRAFGAGRRAGGPVEIGGGAPVDQPGLERGAEADQQHGAVPGPKRRVRRGARRNHQAQHAGHRGGRLAARPCAAGAGDTFHDHGEARVAQVDREAGVRVLTEAVQAF
jgi:hypothetical protein